MFSSRYYCFLKMFASAMLLPDVAGRSAGAALRRAVGESKCVFFIAPAIRIPFLITFVVRKNIISINYKSV